MKNLSTPPLIREQSYEVLSNDYQINPESVEQTAQVKNESNYFFKSQTYKVANHSISPFKKRIEQSFSSSKYEASQITNQEIFGIDNRTKVQNPTIYPYNCIGKIRATFKSGKTTSKNAKLTEQLNTKHGTGGLISQRIVLTSAHVLYDPQIGQRANRVIFMLNVYDRKQKKLILQQVDVEDFYIHPTYFTTSLQNYDMAIIKLKQNDKIKLPQYLKIKWDYSLGKYDKMNVNIAGFKDGRDVIYESICPPRKHEENKNMLYYVNATEPSYSGAPVLFKFLGQDDSKYVVIGIHKGSIAANNCGIILSRISLNSKQIYAQIIENDNLEEYFTEKEDYFKSQHKLAILNQSYEDQNQLLSIENKKLKIQLEQKKEECDSQKQRLQVYTKNSNQRHLRQRVDQLQKYKTVQQNKINELQSIIFDKNYIIQELKKKQNKRNIAILQDELQQTRRQLNFMNEKYASAINEIQRLHQENVQLKRIEEQMGYHENGSLAQLNSFNPNFNQDKPEQQLKPNITDLRINSQEKKIGIEVQNVNKTCLDRVVDFWNALFANNPKKEQEPLAPIITDPRTQEQYVKQIIQKNSPKRLTVSQLDKQFKSRFIKLSDGTVKLVLNGLKLSINEFNRWYWNRVSQLQMIGCGLKSSDWRNITSKTYPKLRKLKIYRNEIKVITLEQLQRMKDLKQIHFFSKNDKKILTIQSIACLKQFQNKNPRKIVVFE